MKSFKDVLAEKERERVRPTRNSVHRSSLLLPVCPLANEKPVIVLGNHFKIKRDIPHVGMRIWGIGKDGNRKFSDHIVLDEARVYRYELAEKYPDYGELSTCQVEFFSGYNLGMPYPAVMVNHVGRGFHNMVHSFGRVLNDVFEADEINSIPVAEASIDVRVDETYDTFFVFQAGAQPVKDSALRLHLRLHDGEVLEATKRLNSMRFTATTVKLSEVFPDRKIEYGSVLKIICPEQREFFGRMMGGIVSRIDGAFSANHSYYDHGHVAEYVDAEFGYNFYPLIPGKRNWLVFYPIQAPSVLNLQAQYFDAEGKAVGFSERQTISSPAGNASVVNISDQAPNGAACYRITARAAEGSKLPSRISHQVAFGGPGLAGSVSETLVFPEHQLIDPNGASKPFLSWIQGVHGTEATTQIGLTLVGEPTCAVPVHVAVYTEHGLHAERTIELLPRGSTVLESRSLVGNLPGDYNYFCLYATCKASRLKMFSVVESSMTGHCSAEHNF